MPRPTRTLLTLALTGAASTAQAFCPPPTLELCRDPAWLETDCGRDAMRHGCHEILADGAMTDSEHLPEAMRLDLDGERVPARLEAYDPSSFRHDIIGDAGWSARVALTAARATARGELDPETRQLRDAWASNGRAFESCDEYVYEKYESISLFEDAIATARHDARLALELARRDTFLADVRPEPADRGPVLVGVDGEPIEGERDDIAWVPRNAFLATPAAFFAANPGLADLADVIDRAAPRPDTLGWHLAAAERLADVPVELLETRGHEADRYAFDLATRARLTDDLAALDRDEDARPEERAAIRAELAALDAAIAAELVAADARGCLRGDEIGVCDWHPRLTIEAITERYAAAREADHRACKTIEADADGDLPAVRGRSIEDMHGDVMYAGQDWLASPREFDTYRSLLAAAAAHRATQAAAEQDAEARRIAEARAALTGANGTVRKPEERHHKLEELGDRTFNLYYEYLMRWRAFDFERILCNVNAEFEAMFRAGATVFGQRFDVIYARLFANLHRFEGDLRIAGQNIYHDHRNLVGALHFDLVKPKDHNVPMASSGSAWFTVVFVPVKVEGGIAGKVGLKYQARAGVDKGGATCTHVDAYVEGKVEPYASLDAFAAVSVDILIARAGIKGRVELLTVSLPFLAKVALRAPQGDIRALALIAQSKLDLTLRALSGAISLWGEAGWCPFCVKGETVIFSWTGPKLSHNIFDVKLSFPLDGLKRILEGA